MKILKRLINPSILFLVGCAQVVNPTGGGKDFTAPKLIEVQPKNKSVNFLRNQGTIRFKFDEYIMLKDASKQIIISPPLKNLPTYNLKGKELEIVFNDTLIQNQTYTINFSNAVVDNHEETPCSNLTYTFSTGTYLDTNTVSGNVYNAFTTLPSENIIVALYNKKYNNDTALLTQYPSYYSKTKADGSYLIENIPKDSFTIVAYKKEGTTIKYAKNDSVAIHKQSILVNENLKPINLYLFKPNEHRVNKIFDTSTTQRGVFQFVVYKPQNFKIKNTDNKRIYFTTIKGTDDKDTLKVFNKFQLDSASYQINTNDTSFKVNIKRKKKNVTFPEFKLDAKNTVKPLDSLVIISTTPIEQITSDSILFQQDSIKIKPAFFKYDEENMCFKLYHDWKESGKYSLIFKDSSLKDIFGTYNETKTFNIDIKAFKEYGSLTLNVELLSSNQTYIIQLINAKNNQIIHEYSINKGTQLKFDYVNPAEIIVKVIKDDNNNGIWDNGDITTKKLPEKVYKYNQIFNVRAFWDLEQIININDLINQQKD
jgi:hypothetical protein